MKRLLDAHGGRIVGLKDSSGDMAYAREMAALSPSFKVFPSTEAVLLDARAGAFAGCISATANLNADLCARAWRSGDAGALDDAVTIRKLFDGKQLVSGVKALLAHIHRDPAWARVQPPLSAFAAADRAAVTAGYDRVRQPARQCRPADPGGRPKACRPALTWPKGPTISCPRWRRGFAAVRFCITTSRRTDDAGCRPPARTRTGMANTTSAQKATRVIARRTEVNKARRSRMRNSVRKVEEAIASGDRNKALEALKAAEPIIQRSAQKGIVHRNAANRKVSRLTKRVAQLGK